MERGFFPAAAPSLCTSIENVNRASGWLLSAGKLKSCTQSSAGDPEKHSFLVSIWLPRSNHTTWCVYPTPIPNTAWGSGWHGQRMSPLSPKGALPCRLPWAVSASPGQCCQATGTLSAGRQSLPPPSTLHNDCCAAQYSSQHIVTTEHLRCGYCN